MQEKELEIEDVGAYRSKSTRFQSSYLALGKMSDFLSQNELVINLIFQITQTIFVMVGVIFASLQLKKISKANYLSYLSQVATHDWQKRKAAKDALVNRSSVSISSLNKEFKYLNSSEPVSIASCFEAFERCENLQADLHQMLNYYEGLCHGIKQGIYDEEVIRTSLGRLMSKILHKFRPYIDNRRKELNSVTAWSDFESFVKKWEHEKALIETRNESIDVDVRDAFSMLPSLPKKRKKMTV